MKHLANLPISGSHSAIYMFGGFLLGMLNYCDSVSQY